MGCGSDCGCGGCRKGGRAQASAAALWARNDGLAPDGSQPCGCDSQHRDASTQLSRHRGPRSASRRAPYATLRPDGTSGGSSATAPPQWFDPAIGADLRSAQERAAMGFRAPDGAGASSADRGTLRPQDSGSSAAASPSSGQNVAVSAPGSGGAPGALAPAGSSTSAPVDYKGGLAASFGGPGPRGKGGGSGTTPLPPSTPPTDDRLQLDFGLHRLDRRGAAAPPGDSSAMETPKAPVESPYFVNPSPWSGWLDRPRPLSPPQFASTMVDSEQDSSSGLAAISTHTSWLDCTCCQCRPAVQTFEAGTYISGAVPPAQDTSIRTTDRAVVPAGQATAVQDGGSSGRSGNRAPIAWSGPLGATTALLSGASLHRSVSPATVPSARADSSPVPVRARADDLTSSGLSGSVSGSAAGLLGRGAARGTDPGPALSSGPLYRDGEMTAAAAGFAPGQILIGPAAGPTPKDPKKKDPKDTQEKKKEDGSGSSGGGGGGGGKGDGGIGDIAKPPASTAQAPPPRPQPHVAAPPLHPSGSVPGSLPARLPDGSRATQELGGHGVRGSAASLRASSSGARELGRPAGLAPDAGFGSHPQGVGARVASAFAAFGIGQPAPARALAPISRTSQPTRALGPKDLPGEVGKAPEGGNLAAEDLLGWGPSGGRGSNVIEVPSRAAYNPLTAKGGAGSAGSSTMSPESVASGATPQGSKIPADAPSGGPTQAPAPGRIPTVAARGTGIQRPQSAGLLASGYGTGPSAEPEGGSSTATFAAPSSPPLEGTGAVAAPGSTAAISIGRGGGTPAPMSPPGSAPTPTIGATGKPSTLDFDAVGGAGSSGARGKGGGGSSVALISALLTQSEALSAQASATNHDAASSERLAWTAAATLRSHAQREMEATATLLAPHSKNETKDQAKARTDAASDLRALASGAASDGELSSRASKAASDAAEARARADALARAARRAWDEAQDLIDEGKKSNPTQFQKRVDDQRVRDLTQFGTAIGAIHHMESIGDTRVARAGGSLITSVAELAGRYSRETDAHAGLVASLVRADLREARLAIDVKRGQASPALLKEYAKLKTGAPGRMREGRAAFARDLSNARELLRAVDKLIKKLSQLPRSMNSDALSGLIALKDELKKRIDHLKLAVKYGALLPDEPVKDVKDETGTVIGKTPSLADALRLLFMFLGYSRQEAANLGFSGSDLAPPKYAGSQDNTSSDEQGFAEYAQESPLSPPQISISLVADCPTGCSCAQPCPPGEICRCVTNILPVTPPSGSEPGQPGGTTGGPGKKTDDPKKKKVGGVDEKKDQGEKEGGGSGGPRQPPQNGPGEVAKTPPDVGPGPKKPSGTTGPSVASDETAPTGPPLLTPEGHTSGSGETKTVAPPGAPPVNNDHGEVAAGRPCTKVDPEELRRLSSALAASDAGLRGLAVDRASINSYTPAAEPCIGYYKTKTDAREMLKNYSKRARELIAGQAATMARIRQAITGQGVVCEGAEFTKLRAFCDRIGLLRSALAALDGLITTSFGFERQHNISETDKGACGEWLKGISTLSWIIYGQTLVLTTGFDITEHLPFGFGGHSNPIEAGYELLADAVVKIYENIRGKEKELRDALDRARAWRTGAAWYEVVIGVITSLGGGGPIETGEVEPARIELVEVPDVLEPLPDIVLAPPGMRAGIPRPAPVTRPSVPLDSRPPPPRPAAPPHSAPEPEAKAPEGVDAPPPAEPESPRRGEVEGKRPAPLPPPPPPPPPPPVNWSHIFEGEINPSGRAVGFHARPGGVDPAGARVSKMLKQPDARGVYEAEIEIGDASGRWIGKNGKSSFYPDSWSPAMVKTEVMSAYANRVQGPRGYWTGRSSSGVQITGYEGPAGIKTAYPVWGK